MKRSLSLVLVLVLALLPLIARAETSDKIEFSEQTLTNGLRVIYAPLHQAPVVHVRVFYHVGSKDERDDRQGFAHMFEHMMFRGSAHVAPEEHMKRIGGVGGYSNAFTSFDETVYVNTVPAQYLEMALWLEADRMASFKVSDTIFQTERKVVAEEWRMRMNRPYGDMYENYLKNAFTTHNYRWTPIGDMDHLKAARSSELQEFFNTHYLPNNATLVIAGDFDPEQAKGFVKKFYEWIPKGELPARMTKDEPPQNERREAEVKQAVPLTMILMGWHVPQYRSNDNYALATLSTIMGAGDSSRLMRLLVNGANPMCVQAEASHWQLEDSGVFGIGAGVMTGKDPKKVQEMLAAAVADVIDKGVTPEELDKAKAIVKVSLIEGRKTAESLASQLADEAVKGGDANRVNTALAKVEALKPVDLQKVAAKYLQADKATILVTKPSLMAAVDQQIAASQAAAVKDAPVVASTAPVKPRVTEFPKDYPTTAPSADPKKAPEFVKGVETDIDGVKVIVMEYKRLPLVEWAVTMRRGSQSDPKGKEGTAWLTSEMVKRGVKGMSFEELTKDLDSRAISISVGDGGDNTRLNGSATTDQLEHAIERSRQVLLEPTFPEEEFAKLKAQSIDSLKVQQESPTAVAGNDLTAALYGDTPIGRYSTPKSVGSIELADVKSFYEKNYRPDDAIVIISGDVTVEKGQELAKKLLAGWTRSKPEPVEIDLAATASTRKIILVDRPQGKQATVRMGIRAFDLHSDEKYAGAIATHILSSGIDSRLGKYVRAEKGLAYGVYGRFTPNRQAGAFMGSIDTAIESTAAAVEAMFQVFDRMRKEDVTPAELAEAKMRVAGGMVMAVQTIGQQAGYRVDGILNGYPIDYYDKYPARVAEVTAQQVREVLNKYVKDGEMTIVVVAPAKLVRAQLEKLGEVEVVPMPAAREAATTQPAKKAA